MKLPTIPFVIILDIDSTIVGDVAYVMEESSLHEMLRQKCAMDDTVQCSRLKGNFVEAFEGGLLRPYVKEFLMAMQSAYSPLEIFVFSSGSDHWVPIIVSEIEKYCGIHVHRPLFSRGDTVLGADQLGAYSFTKSINLVSVRIINALKDRYKALNTEENCKHMIASRLLMLDDRSDVIIDQASRHIKVPAYNYSYAYDITCGLPKSLRESPLVAQYMKAMTKGSSVSYPFIDLSSSSPSSNDNHEARMRYHLEMASLMERMLQSNASYTSDTVFKKLLKMLVKKEKAVYKDWPDKVIRSINKRLDTK